VTHRLLSAAVVSCRVAIWAPGGPEQTAVRVKGPRVSIGADCPKVGVETRCCTVSTLAATDTLPSVPAATSAPVSEPSLTWAPVRVFFFTSLAVIVPFLICLVVTEFLARLEA